MRNSGRTTRTIFAMLAQTKERVVLVSVNKQICRHNAETMMDILSKLNWDFTFNKNTITVTNFGRDFIFLTTEDFERQRPLRKFEIFFDHYIEGMKL